MNASARMRRRIVRGAGVLFLVFVAVVWGWVNTQLTSLPRRELSSVHFADPVELTLDGEPIRVTRFVLHPADRLLILEQDELTFNDYGDATRVGGKQPRVLWARYARQPFRDCFVLATAMRPRPVLVLWKDAENTARLIIPTVGRGDRPARITELRGPEIIPDEFGDQQQGESLSFHSLDSDMNLINVSGSLTEGGTLHIDRNGRGFEADGSISSRTLVAFPHFQVTFKPLGPDPLNRGRRAFELVPKETPEPEKRNRWSRKSDVQPGEWILVLGLTELSEHRLLFKANGVVRQVLRLENDERNNCRYQIQKLRGIPPKEQAAIRELASHNRFQVLDLRDNHITMLVGVKGALASVDSILSRLPHLTSLGFQNASLPESGLPGLEQLTGLTESSFTSSELSDGGLVSVGKATTLRHLNIHYSKGPTAAGFAHLAPLINLKFLGVSHPTKPLSGPEFNEALKHLAGMKRLAHLDLSGQHLSDAGLAHIGRLTSLTELSIGGPEITDAGLQHLMGLTNLTRFSLEAPNVSHAALQAFRARIPGLR